MLFGILQLNQVFVVVQFSQHVALPGSLALSSYHHEIYLLSKLHLQLSILPRSKILVTFKIGEDIYFPDLNNF